MRPVMFPHFDLGGAIFAAFLDDTTGQFRCAVVAAGLTDSLIATHIYIGNLDLDGSVNIDLGAPAGGLFGLPLFSATTGGDIGSTVHTGLALQT